MNSDKRIINVVGSMGGLKTTKSSLSWEVLKKVKEGKEDNSDGANNHRNKFPLGALTPKRPR